MTTDGGAPAAPRFAVVLRGYDRRQVDEHVARLQRVIARMRADLTARNQQEAGPGRPLGGRAWPAGPGPAPAPGETPDMIGGFTDRMQRILQSAEEEAEEIRSRARTEGDTTRAELAELTRQRDAMLGELAQVRSQLEGLLSAQTTRLSRTELATAPDPSRRTGPPPVTGATPGERPAAPSPRPRPRPATAPTVPLLPASAPGRAGAAAADARGARESAPGQAATADPDRSTPDAGVASPLLSAIPSVSTQPGTAPDPEANDPARADARGDQVRDDSARDDSARDDSARDDSARDDQARNDQARDDPPTGTVSGAEATVAVPAVRPAAADAVRARTNQAPSSSRSG